MIIVDGDGVLVSSQNWSDFAVSKNREAGVWLRHAEIAGYFASIFEHDWADAFQELPDDEGVPEMLTSRSLNGVVSCGLSGPTMKRSEHLRGLASGRTAREPWQVALRQPPCRQRLPLASSPNLRPMPAAIGAPAMTRATPTRFGKAEGPTSWPGMGGSWELP